MEGPEPTARAWARIDLGALRRNYQWLIGRAGGRRLIPVVKADGYGHGAGPVARALRDEAAPMLAVATLGEAGELRASGDAGRLLLLGPLLDPPGVGRARELDLDVVATGVEALELLAGAAPAGAPLRVHLKVDTGMGRLGLQPDELGAALARLGRARGLRLEGLMSHLAEADDPGSPRTPEQRARFTAALERVRGAGLAPEWIHVDGSAGIVRGGQPGANAARPGIALYGGAPTLERDAELEPVMTLLARVVHALDAGPGTRVGYGGEWVARAPARVLTAAIGYADGFPRGAGPHRVGLRGERLALAGRVSCDLIGIEAPAAWRDELGEPVLIFGRHAGMEIGVDELADAAGTISYEILTRIGPRVPRVY